MYIVEQLKLNKFEHVSIPNNSELWMRSGCLRALPTSSQFTGDESMPMAERKTDVFAHVSAEELNQLRREAAEVRDKQQEEEDS